MDIYEELKRFCYWEEGEYEVELRVNTTDHDDPFREEYKFRLEKEDADQLRTNVIGILRTIAGLEPNYHFAYPDLQKVD